MSAQATSLNDIAKALGVSISTVSRALKDHPDISESTRERVKAFAEMVKYRPNALALGLKYQKTNTIGILIPEIVHHFFSSIISGVEDIAYKSGYQVMICQSNENSRREEMSLQALLDHRVDGMLISISKSTADFSHINAAFENKIPIVFFDRFCKDIETDRVITNDFEGARLLCRHLIERGCKNILHLAAPQNLLIGAERQRGYGQALVDNGFIVREDNILLCDTPEKVLLMKDKILEKAAEVDGIFAVNDFTAIEVMKFLKKHGYKIPEDIAIAGFGDDPIATIIEPSLTTVEQNGYEIGKEAMRMLISRIENTESVMPPQIKVVNTILRKRESTANNY